MNRFVGAAALAVLLGFAVTANAAPPPMAALAAEAIPVAAQLTAKDVYKQKLEALKVQQKAARDALKTSEKAELVKLKAKHKDARDKLRVQQKAERDKFKASNAR